MNFQGISAILLFAFTIPVVMKYRILPIEGTPYWLFGILFLSLIAYALLSIYPKLISQDVLKKYKLSVWLIRIILLVVSVGISLGGASFTAIADRHRIAPVWGTHDIVLQQEAAMRYLVQGKNPYKETYFNTPVEMFEYEEIGNPNAINPALYHYVMPPGYLLLHFPFYWISNRLFGYFDARIVSVVFLILVIGVFLRWFKNKELAHLSIILISLSPATVDYFIEGRSDFFALTFLIAALFLMYKKYTLLSTIAFAFALLGKQTMWFATPLFITFLYTNLNKNLKKLSYLIGVLLGVGIIFTLPFVLWDADAFIKSVVLYLSSGGKTGYPVSGYGLSMILYDLKIIKDLHQYYPFLLWQFGIGIPVVGISIWVLRKSPKVSNFFICFALILFSFWYTSRYFNNSHVAVVATLFILGILKQYDEKPKQTDEMQ